MENFLDDRRADRRVDFFWMMGLDIEHPSSGIECRSDVGCKTPASRLRRLSRVLHWKWVEVTQAAKAAPAPSLKNHLGCHAFCSAPVLT